MPHSTSPRRFEELHKHVGEIYEFISSFYHDLNVILAGMANENSTITNGGIYITYSFNVENMTIDVTTINLHYMTKHSERTTFALAQNTIDIVEDSIDEYNRCIETDENIVDIRSFKTICSWETETVSIEDMCSIISPRGVLITISNNRCGDIIYVHYEQYTYYSVN